MIGTREASIYATTPERDDKRYFEYSSIQLLRIKNFTTVFHMKIQIFWTLIFCATSVFSQEVQPPKKEIVRVAPNPQVGGEKGKQVPLEGIILVPPDRDVKGVPQEHGIHIYLNKSSDEPLISALETYLNHPLSGDVLKNIRQTIVDYYKNEKKRYVAVLVPMQDVTDGVIVLQILPGEVGAIHFMGQKWFSEKTLSKSLDLKKGDPIVEEDLMNYMSWVNRNPFRRTQLILEPGDEKGTTNVNFLTKERFPIRFFTGSDNTGFLSTGQVRLYGGINWGNALKLGDLISYQYTASTDFNMFQSHVLSYTSFLPWKNVLTVFGCFGVVVPQIPTFTTTGKNIQVSGRYSIPFLPLYGDFLHHLDAGFDWKYITTNLFFAGDPLQGLSASNSGNIINVTQFLIAYGLQKNWTGQVVTFNSNLFASVWKDLLPFQSTLAYNNLRPGSHVRYAYLKLSLSHRYKFANDCVLSSLFRGQLASNTIPTSEQFGFGGADTVRGYYEQQFVADNAILFNFELYSKPLSLFKGHKNELTFLAFIDYGYGRNYTYSLPELKQQHLIGIGPGFRYDIMPYLSVKMDYGFQLQGIPLDHRTGRFHFSLNVSN
jgi:hemolysin activation/secretion protein